MSLRETLQKKRKYHFEKAQAPYAQTATFTECGYMLRKKGRGRGRIGERRGGEGKEKKGKCKGRWQSLLHRLLWTRSNNR